MTETSKIMTPRPREDAKLLQGLTDDAQIRLFAAGM